MKKKHWDTGRLMFDLQQALNEIKHLKRELVETKRLREQDEDRHMKEIKDTQANKPIPIP